MQDLQHLVDAADEAALLRAVDSLCAAREWEALVDLAGRCMEAVEFGKQLWPVAMHIEYRLAFEAPGDFAGAVLRPGAARFALGPLTEVAASTHDWASLAPHIRDPASAATTAQERVIRGEDLTAVPLHPPADLPLRLARWEPNYALPTYRDRSAEFPQPDAATRNPGAIRRLPAGAPIADDAGARALRQVVETWISESSGQVRTAVVSGGATAAVGGLSGPRSQAPRVDEAAMLQLSPAEAIALLQWAGASGGAHGHRRGGAAGRFSAWWAAAALTGLPWPAEGAADDSFAEDLGVAIAELDWFRWRPPGPDLGWVLRLAVADPVDGLAWAVDAVDHSDDDA